jgi:magnesium transporter
MFDSLYESANSEPDEGKEKDKDMENLNLIPDITEEYAIISSFFGNEKREKCRYLRDIIDGTSGFNSGLLYLKDRCDTLLEQIQELQEDVKYTLEERRNFYSFLLTAITIGIAPITILTGYFGMNFENMTELHPETFPSTPGVELLWVILIVFYGLLFVISVHSGLFYKLFC